MREQTAQHAPIPARASRRPDAHVSSPNGAGHESGLHNEDQPYLTDEQAARRQSRAGRPVQQQQRRMPPAPADEDDDDAVYDTRLPSSTRRYQDAPAPQRQSAMRVRYGDGERLRSAGAPARSTTRSGAVPMRDGADSSTPRRRFHPLVYVGTGLLTLATGWTLISGAIAVGHTLLDDWTYGNPRVERVTAVVGHHDSAEHPSLFFAINDDGHAQVVECPAGDCRHAQAYVPDLLLPQDSSSTPVTIEFKDVNGDGKPDLLIHVGGQTTIWINDQGAFRPATDKDTIKL